MLFTSQHVLTVFEDTGLQKTYVHARTHTQADAQNLGHN